MDAVTLKYILAALLLLDFLGEQLLEYLNLRQWKPEMPAELIPFTNPTTYQRDGRYQRDRFRLGLIKGTLATIVTLTIIWTGALRYLSDYLFARLTEDQVWQSLVLFGILGFGSFVLQLPFTLYLTFVLKARYGFNRISPREFWLDRLKGVLLAIIIGGPVCWILLTMILHTGPRFWLYAWVIIAIVSLLTTVLYKSFLLSLFNKLTALQPGTLRDKIEDFCRKVSNPVSNIFVLKGSHRLIKAKAFISGLGKMRKIILTDSLVNKFTEDEVVAVLAHEAGHFKQWHILQRFMVGQIITGFTLWLLSLILDSPAPAQALGAEVPSLGLSLIVFAVLYIPVSDVLNIASNTLSRKHDYEADVFAARTADKEAFKAALLKLSADNPANLRPHPAYVFVHFSHPPVIDRIKALG